MKTPKISVALVTYNHEKYIAQCLDSILMQKGIFDLEVIIGDDYSTDKTGQIVRDYQRKYPHMVVVLPTTANMGIPRNVKRCLDACSGDFIALCDGDDYWTDTYKLAKQVEFLESHPDYSGCFNAVMIYHQKDNSYEPFSPQLSLEKDTLTTEDIIECDYPSGASTTMYRTSIIRKLPEEIYNRFLGDWVIAMACGRMGKIGFIRDWMSVHRTHSEGVWCGAAPVDQWRNMSAAIDGYNQLFCYDYARQFLKMQDALEKNIHEYEKQLQFLSRQVLYKYGYLLIRAIKHPRKAYKILSSTIAELATSGVSAKDFQIAKLDSSAFASLIIESALSRKLNVGCGKVKLPGWVSIDIEPGADLVIDVREGLPFDDNSVHFIYNEHFIEHLTYEEGEKVLREFWRCLKKGGVLRIATPDLDFLIQLYNRDFKNQDWFPDGFKFVKTKGMAMNMTFSWWGHKFLYNEEELKNQLSKAGFQNIKKCELNKSNYSELSNLETRKESTLILEAVKE